ncbi:MAG TPA: PAS domain S-box protein [Povalibacter sp.]|nr:PAS domain S-box protein [Povalibacter sp.]
MESGSAQLLDEPSAGSAKVALLEEEVARFTRLYAALNGVHRAATNAPSRRELFQTTCEALISTGGFKAVWIGWVAQDTSTLNVQARIGSVSDVRNAVNAIRDLQTGSDPASIAFRKGERVIADWSTSIEEQRETQLAGNVVAALPIFLNSEVRGVLCVHAATQEAFRQQERDLLDAAAANISLALDAADREQARLRTQRILSSEKSFSDTMIQSMPGVVYLYDVTGRFLRWNRNFEVVSGYSGEEISRMHPLDFFAEKDRPKLQEKIAEVFAKGESSVESPFVARDGRSIPYFFTGRRVLFESRECLVGVGIDISDRLRAEQSMATSERKYRELVEHANSIILRWTVDGRITFLNEYGQRFFGYTSDEIIGRHVMDTIVPSTDSDGHNLQALMQEICASPDDFEQNTNENVRRNGERVWISWTNRLEYDATGNVVEILSVGTDITARRRVEERLRESEAHLIDAQRIARIGSWQLDLKTWHLRWSGQVCEIFGIDPTNASGNYDAFTQYVHPQDRAMLSAALQEAMAGRARLDIQHRIVLRDGTERVVQALGDVKLDAQGVPALLLGTVHDVTDRVRIEAERERRYRAEEADRIKSAFLATMSHELRTPLNSIIGFTGVLLQGLAGPLNPEQNKQLDMVRTSARHLLALVNDVLDISKIEAGQLEIFREPYDVQRSVEKVVNLVRPQALARHLELRTVLGQSLGSLVGDARRFEQVLLNLLSNAIKFTEQGSIELRAEHIEGFTMRDGTSPGSVVRVSVTDTGVGIKPDDLALLFQPFRQLDSGLARKHEGTGLGLAICARLVDLMDGEINVRSRLGEGSTFEVILPVDARAGA